MTINPLFAKGLLTAQTKCSKDIYICLPQAFDDRSNFLLHCITNVGFGDIGRSHHRDVIGGKGYHWNLFILSPVHFPLPASNDLLGDVLCSWVQTTGARHLCLLFWDLTYRLPQWPSSPFIFLLVHPGLQDNIGHRGVAEWWEAAKVLKEDSAQSPLVF